MNQEVFKPVRGTEASILSQTPQKGYVYFALDTRKIYYSDGEDFLSMGGNSGIYYGSLSFESPPDSDLIDFTFSPEDIEGDHLPNENDLILNIPDGCFYRVNNIEISDEITVINTTKLTIAGSGSGGGAIGVTLKVKNNLNSMTVYCVDGQDAEISFNVSSSAEDDSIQSIIYKIGSIETIIDEDGHDMGDITFNLKPYTSLLSSATNTQLSVIVTDIYGVQKTLTYVLSRVSIALTEDSTTPTILQASNYILNYTCTPIGGNNLVDKEIIYTVYNDVHDFLTSKRQSVNYSNNTYIYDINFNEIDGVGIGTYTLEVKFVGYTNTNHILVESNVLTHSIISYAEEPLLVAYINTNSIEQYSNLTISYMIGTSNSTLTTTEISLIQNDKISVQEVPYNEIQTWTIYFDKAGAYDLSLSDSFGHSVNFNNFNVTPYNGNIPVIDDSLSTLKLNLSAINRSNTEINKNSWENRGFSSIFENFIWENFNGWLLDEDNTNILRVSSGAKLTIDNPNGGLFSSNLMNSSGCTIELDFKVSGVTDFSKPLISCISKTHNDDIQVGFQITGQTSTLNTAEIKASVGSIREEESDEAQAYNTAIQGLTTKFIENERIHLTWVIEKNTLPHPMIKTYLNGVLSGITEYTANGEDSMIENISDKAKLIFDSTYGIIDIYNIRVYNTDLTATNVLNNYIATIGRVEEKANKYNDNFGLLDSAGLISIPSIEGGSYQLNIPYIKFTGGDGLIKDDNGYRLNPQDSSQHLPYAKKDYRLIKQFDFIDPRGIHEDRHLISSFKDGYLNGVVFYGQGTSSMEYPIKNLRVKFKMKKDGKKVKFQINSNDYPVDILTLKADYMESSSSHNTGTANLIFDLLESGQMHTPGQEYYNRKNPDYKTLTAIRGYPIICFFRRDENSPYEYIGRYNLNMDKSSEDAFGFLPDPIEAPEVVTESTFGWANANDTITNHNEGIVNTIHCYEFLNNASNLCNFLNPENEQTFEEYAFFKQVKDEKGNNVPAWFTSFESRYPEGEAKDGSDVDIESWFELCSWVNSTATTEASGEPGDTIEDRLLKFKTEFEEHFNLQFATFYYVLTHVLLMIDSRTKNMMMATWDNQIWYPIFYDMDTMLGLNNYGYNKFGYDVEDSDANIFNGQNSVLWNNFKICFPENIKTMYNTLEKTYLNYNNLLYNYNTIQADAWNEMLYNEDAKYKYIDPYAKGYYNGLSGSAEWVQPGTKNYLYAGQGSRSMHRKYWLKNRLNYFDGKYLSDTYKTDKFIMRLYTPDAESNPNSKLNASLQAVPPNNDFILTPLYNQYLSVAFGGDNGTTTEPLYSMANISKTIEAPSGSKFNDTETYIYGGSLLKDLGDLSPQYLGSFVLPDKETKLERLTLGNLNNDYYNPNFSALNIGVGAPYLKVLNIANCFGLQAGLDLSHCQNINTILATGTQLKNITLPEHGVIAELRLPITLTTLTLIDQPFLTNDHFTIGTYDSDTNEYSANVYTNLQKVYIDKVPSLNTYDLVLNAQNLQDYAFLNIDWTLSDNNQEIDKINKTIFVLEFLQNKRPILPVASPVHQQSLSGTLTIPDTINDDLALELYQKYWTIFPNLKFNFESENIVWVNIYDGNNKIYWYRPIKKNSIIYDDDENLGIEGFLKDSPMGAFIIPVKNSTIQHIYTFTNTWQVNNEVKDSLIGLTVNETLNIYPIFDEEIHQYEITFKNGTDEIITQSYGYGTLIKNILPTAMYKDDSSLEAYRTYAFLGFNTDPNAREALIFNDDDIVTSSRTYFAIFSDEISVKNSANVNMDYYNFTLKTYYDEADPDFNTSGYIATVKDDVTLKGKITIPAQYNGKPIVAIDGFATVNSVLQNQITGVFFEEGTEIRYLPDYCFQNVTSLIYFEIPNSLREIGNYAFTGNNNLKFLTKDQSKNDTTYYIGAPLSSNLYKLGIRSFQNCIDSACTDLWICSSIQKTSTNSGGEAFANFNNAYNLRHIYIGHPEKGSCLDISNPQHPLRMNTSSAPPLIDVTFYLSPTKINSVSETSQLQDWIDPYYYGVHQDGFQNIFITASNENE